ncbi:hypothetical protein IV203_035078 [Nitzschia inconspicua]|uniref:Uncharacterized protein n=1 Tax=Nitzschia inconspicua TaxID=303405 RepID=A0A9K3PU83_9STRA|nr:hypothetical protein IV203_035078 [Nitzschia inconspicua]
MDDIIMEEERDEAALIDSFFLPGGIFADEDDDDDGGGKNNDIILVDTVVDGRENSRAKRNGHSRIPSNPWQSSSEYFAADENDTTIAIPESILINEASGRNNFSSAVQRQIPLEEQHQTCGHNPHQNLLYLKTSFLLHFQENLYAPSDPSEPLMSQSFFSHQQNQAHQVQSGVSLCHGCGNEEKTIVTPPPGFQSFKSDETTNVSLTTPLTNLVNERIPVESNRETKVAQRLPENDQMVEIGEDQEEDHRYQIVFSGNESNVDAHGDQQSQQRHSASKRDDDENTEEEDDDDDDDDDEDDDEDDEENDDENDASIPADVYGLSGSESNICSSLSTSSDFDISDDDASGVSRVDLVKAGDFGYDTDQAHVSHIVVVAECNDVRSASTTPGAVYSGEQTPPFSSNSQQSMSQRSKAISRFRCMWANLVEFFLFLIFLPVNPLCASYISILEILPHCAFFSIISNRAKRILRQSIHISRGTANTVFKSFQKVRVVTGAFLVQIIRVSCKIVAFATKMFLLVFHIFLQAWKFASFEATEEPQVASGYVVFYFMPSFCSYLMRNVNLPHWMPHLLTLVGVYSLCHQIESGPLLVDESSLFQSSVTKFTEKVSLALEKRKPSSDDKDATTTSPSSRVSLSKERSRRDHLFWEGHHQRIIPRDELACSTILKILRLVLPVFFVADGFSSEFGTIMGVSGASRLTTSFMMSLVRKNLVSSPIGWSSWAIQVLAATYFSKWALLDIMVAIVGLSSIRLIRFLDGERAKKRQRRA